MARLLLTTEGPTEQLFAAQVLRPHLAALGVFLDQPRCTAICRKHGLIQRGGLLKYKPMRDDILGWVKQDISDDARFSTMIDLYALPNDFPGFEESKRFRNPYDRVAFLEQAFADDLNSQRFIPYIQLHEFEALLLADYRKLCDYYGQGRVADLQPLAEAIIAGQNPELIDDGEGTAPSKRIAACIPEYAVAKATAGPIVAGYIGLDTLRRACRHFGEWLGKLELLGP